MAKRSCSPNTQQQQEQSRKARLTFSPSDVVKRGFAYLDIRTTTKRTDRLYFIFKKEYGATPVELAKVWYDLLTTDVPEAKLLGKDVSEKGFKRFLMAYYFLWIYPKNSEQFASRFHVCERYARGPHIWDMIAKIAALMAQKIVLDAAFDDDSTEKFIMTLDGTDFRIWEPKHPTLPVDKGFCSHKFKKAGLRYEIGISLKQSRVVWVNGPYRGGASDLQIYNEKLRQKIRPGKLIIADGTYKGDHCAPPDCMESPELQKFKSRARLRQETFNARLKTFQCLRNLFRHGMAKHKMAVEAICVTLQYQMEMGSELYDI
jgi:hypothetical protein